MYRVRGHLIANLDPLGRREPHTHPELDIQHYGLIDLGPRPRVPGQRARIAARSVARPCRCATSSASCATRTHAPSVSSTCTSRSRSRRTGSRRASRRRRSRSTAAQQRRILERLNAAEAYEGFIHTKYLGQKRFSLEGAECLIPMLDAVLTDAADAGMAEVVLGTAHRGRLNVLVNTIGKSYGQIFREFEGALDPASVAGLGRREVPRRRGRHPHHADRREDRRHAWRRTPATSKPSTPWSRAWPGPRSDRRRRRDEPLAGAPRARARRRRVRGPGRRGRDAQPLRGPGLRGRRHHPHRREQPARVHDRARARRARASTRPTSRRWCRRRSST